MKENYSSLEMVKEKLLPPMMNFYSSLVIIMNTSLVDGILKEFMLHFWAIGLQIPIFNKKKLINSFFQGVNYFIRRLININN